MRYTAFTITNYRGISRTQIDLGSSQRTPVTTLIGLNESGKTTLLEAINSFTYGREDISHLELYGYRPPDPYDLVPIAQRSNFNGNVSLKADIELKDADVAALKSHLHDAHKWTLTYISRKLSVSDVWRFTNSRHTLDDKERNWTITITGKPAGSKSAGKAIDHKNEIWQSAVKFIGDRTPQIWYFPNFLFDFPNRVYLEDNDDLQGTKADRNEFFRGLIRAALQEVDSRASIEDHLVERAKSKDPADRKSLESICLKLGRHLTATVFEAWSEAVKSQIGSRSLKFAVLADEKAKVYASIQIEDSDGIFEIAERSLGFRWFFVFLLITRYVAEAGVNSTNDTLLLLDEPASNLHSTAQQRLLDYFSKLSTSVTLIYATHSHHLIDPKRLESAYVVMNKGLAIGNELNFKSTNTQIEAIRYREFVSSHPDQTSYFQPVLDILEYRPAKLEKIPAIALIEGKSDYYLLMLLLKAGSHEPLPYSLYPGGGAGSLDSIIGLYIAWARDFVVLLDSDREGRNQRTRYTERFSHSISDRIRTLSDVTSLPPEASLESLLTEHDIESLALTAFGTAQPLNKKQILGAAQTCLVQGAIPKFSPQSLELIKQIDAWLRTMLTN